MLLTKEEDKTLLQSLCDMYNHILSGLKKKIPDAVCLSVIIGIQSHRNGFHLSHRLKDDMWNNCLHTLMDLIGKITCLDTVLGTTV